MRVVALLAVRNEARYLARCLEHLWQQGVETCLIDHASTDATPDIARAFRGRGVFRIEQMPFDGKFSLTAQLLYKEQLAADIAADWFIHHDADEIRYAPAPYANLCEGLTDVARQGYNAVDFDEFVFLPTQETAELTDADATVATVAHAPTNSTPTDAQHFTGFDYVAALRHYYYYEPDAPDRYRINAWRKTDGLDLHTHAGHQALFPSRRVFPHNFIMRHYIVLSRAHALEKYAARRFDLAELAQQWHSDRAAFRATDFSFPPAHRLKKLDVTEVCDTSEPWRTHPLFAAGSRQQAAGSEGGAGSRQQAAGSEGGASSRQQAAGSEGGAGSKQQAAGSEGGASSRRQIAGNAGVAGSTQHSTLGINHYPLTINHSRLRAYQAAHADAVPLIPPITDESATNSTSHNTTNEAIIFTARPFWSVVIPAYNPVPEHLAATLQAVLQQALAPAEMQIEVVDDGTTTYDLAAFVAQHGAGRVSYYRQPQRLGIVGNWNACLRRARGWWVHLLHQDDLVSPDWYARIRAVVETRPDVVAVFCRTSGLDDAGTVTWTQHVERETPGLVDDSFLRRLVRDNFILTPALAVRRAFFEEFGGYHEGLPYCADWDLNKRLAVCGVVWYEPELRAYYREHAASATARLQRDAADFADRRKSAQLSEEYLPPALFAETQAAARNAALVWAAEVLHKRLSQGDFVAATAQAQAIYYALSESEKLPEVAPLMPNPQLQQELERLTAEVKAWQLTAERLAHTNRERGLCGCGG